MSKTKDGKHRQSDMTKHSLNLKPEVEEAWNDIRFRLEAARGAPLRKTQVYEEIILGFHFMMTMSEKQAMRKHERRSTE